MLLQANVDAQWEPWSAWSTCSHPCFGGKQNRSRNCTEGKYGGQIKCIGNDTEELLCNMYACPGQYVI